MKTIFKLIIVFFSFFYNNALFAQNDYLWPIEGKIEGDNILYKPQSFIETEPNPDNLIIGAKLNSNVICPKDGKINFISYTYLVALSYSFAGKLEYPKNNIDIESYDQKYRIELANDISKKNNNISIDPKYISITIGITTNNNEIYYISGLRPIKYFKTGEQIKQGEILGKVGFCYNRIKTPSIMFSRTVKSKTADPMSVFGLKSTFIAMTETKKDYLKLKHPIDKLKEAFSIFKLSLEEGHPGLYDYSTKSFLDSLFEKTLTTIKKPMTSEEFRNHILPILNAIKDSHTSLYSTIYNNNDFSVPPVILGAFDNKLKIISATNSYQNYLNEEVVKINDEDVNTVISKIKNTIIGADGYIQSLKECSMMFLFMRYYRLLYQTYDGYDFKLNLANGKELKVKYSKKNKPTPLLTYRPFIKNGFQTKRINSKTAYLGLASFDLLQNDEDEIKEFIKNISDSLYENLIIDLRFNMGGSDEVLVNLFSLFAKSNFQIKSYSKVNKINTFDFFKYTINYTNVTGLFTDYEFDQEKNGFIKNSKNSPNDFELKTPNSDVHFAGNIYVLTNEYSLSASTIFAGLINKYKRGLVIGRETASTYYQLNALKFAQVMLGETALELRIPLIKEVFTDEMNEKIQWGRGVIPDYEVPLTLEELTQNEDKILNYTLELIEKLKK